MTSAWGLRYIEVPLYRGSIVKMQLIIGVLERIVFYVIRKSDEKSLTVNSEQFYVMYQAWDAVFHYQMKYWEESWKYDEQRSILPLTCDVRFQSVTRPSLLNWYTHKRDIFSPKPTRLVQTLFATVHYLPDEILQSFTAFQYKPSPFCNSWIATVYPSTDYGLIAVTRTLFKSDKRWNSYLTSIRSWPSKVECYCAESY